MLKEFEERIENAKNKQFRMLERFHIGDAVYPFWLKNFIVYGIVIDVDTVARKVICDFNGVRRQFCPEDLMHVNPELINASTDKKRNASAKCIDRKEYGFYVVLNDGNIESGWEFKEDAADRKKELAEDSVSSKVLTRRSLGDKPLDNANWHKGAITASVKNAPDGAYSKFDETHLSPDTDNGIRAVCTKCGGEIAVSYDEKTATSDFVCTKCGHRIPEDKVSKETKKAMRENQMRHMNASSSSIGNVTELANLLKRTIADIDNGRHCWCQMPSGNWFCTEDEDDEDGKGMLCCYINEKVDSLGYPYGEMLVNCGIVKDESDAEDVAEYAFECDAEIMEEEKDDDEPDPDEYNEGHAKEWMERHPHGWYNSESDYGTGDEDNDRFASNKALAQELARIAKMLMKRG